METLFTDTSFWIYGIAMLVAGLLLVIFGRQAVRRWRVSDGTWKPRLALARSALGFLVSAFFFLVLGITVAFVVRGTLTLDRLVDEPAPELAFLRLPDATPGSLAAHRGSVVVVNLWATWCPPCIEEMPELDRLQETYRDQGLLVLQLSDEPRETILDYLRSSPMSTLHGVVEPFPWPAYARPTTWVVDRQGIVRRTFVGSRSFSQFEDAVRDYL